MHCEVPTCVDACPTGATYKDPADGAVKIDETLCIGCSSCVGACPYQARYRHPIKNVVDKCDYCSTKQPEGSLPACVETCPTKARVFGDIRDPASEAGKLFKKTKTVQVVNQRSNTNPQMFYLNETSPMDWPLEISSPTPVKLWEKAAKPVVLAATGINALAVFAMLGRQFIDRKDKVARENDEVLEENHE
jgi:tetrathionate reductase subunit B